MGIDGDLDLSGLAEGPIPGDGGKNEMTVEELQEHGKEILWASDEMPPPENVAYSLRRIDGALGEIIEGVERVAIAQERIAKALEQALTIFAK